MQLVVFDLDGTIVRRDSFLGFLLYVFRRHPRLWWQSPFLAWAVFAHFFLGRSNHWLKAFFLQRVVGGLKPGVVDEEAGHFVENFLKRTLRPGAQEVLNQPLQESEVRLLLSASPDFLVQRFGQRLGFDHVESTRAERDELGRPTGGLVGGNCHGAAKVERVMHFIEQHGPFDRLIAYTDHHSDIPLLDWVDEPCCVHPTPRLAEWASDHPRAKVLYW